MYRNDSIQKIPHLPLSPQSSLYSKPSQIIIKTIQSPTQYAVMQKTRALSHKKLTITSALPSPVANDGVKKVIMPTFEINKFYRPPTKGNVMLQSKKSNFEQSKVSLKISNVTGVVNSPLRPKEQINQQNNFRNQVINITTQRQNLKNQLKQILNNKVFKFQQQICEQSQYINVLKQRIQFLQTQLNKKSQLLSYLHSQNQNIKQGNQLQTINLRLTDIQKILTVLSKQESSAQQSINNKLDDLTRKLVQMKLNSQTRQLRELKSKLQAINDKVYEILNKQNEKLKRIQILQQQVVQNLMGKVAYGTKVLEMLSESVGRIQENNMNKNKEALERITETQDSINYWQTFQDYVLTNRSQNQIKNVSIFAQDDYFFHPQLKIPTFGMQSSQISIPETYKDSPNKYNPSPKLQDYSPPKPSQSNSIQSSAFSNMLSIMQHLKTNYHSQLPLKCKIDKHSRIVLKQNNRALQNQETKLFYKVNEEQIKILINRNYLDVIPY